MMNQRFANFRRWLRLLLLCEAYVALGPMLATPTWARNYSFVNIASSRDNFSLIQGGAINNHGTVAFQGVRAGVAGIYSGNGGPITTIADTAGSFSDVGSSASINDGGLVAFAATLDTGVKGIFTGTGGSTTPIVDNSGPFDSFDPPIINTNDLVAFSAQFDNGNSGIYVINGGTLTPIATLGGAETFIAFDPPTMNNLGTVAFLGYRSFGGMGLGSSGIYTGNGGALTPIVGAGLPTATFSDPSINDSGSIAYVRYGSNGEPYSIFVSGTSTPVVTTSAGGFGNFQSPSLNNLGNVAFMGYLYSYPSTGDFGIFAGPDPIADKVIQPGDPLFGSTVTSVDLSLGRRLDDHGDIAFNYALANGVKGIAIARIVLPGDYNQNGVVDAADYTIWRDTLGSTTDLRADGNGNGVIDQGDFDVWKAHFGEHARPGSGSAASVPEPATLVIAVIGAIALVGRRGARKHQSV
jgi:hypothetical protein